MAEKFLIIAQSSLTYAYKGEAILRENGMRVQILKLSGQKTQRGCGYGLSVKASDLQRALSLLRQRGAFIGEIIK